MLCDVHPYSEQRMNDHPYTPTSIHLFSASELTELSQQHDALTLINPSIAEYYSIRQQLSLCSTKLHDIMINPIYALPFLNPGRLVKVKDGDVSYDDGRRCVRMSCVPCCDVCGCDVL